MWKMVETLCKKSTIIGNQRQRNHGMPENEYGNQRALNEMTTILEELTINTNTENSNVHQSEDCTSQQESDYNTSFEKTPSKVQKMKSIEKVNINFTSSAEIMTP